MIVADTLQKVNTFLKYHDDENNWRNNESNYDKMYEILSKYGDESEDVGTVFERATPEDQDRMIELIKPGPEIGSIDWFRDLYHSNVIEKVNGRQYAEGFSDALFALAELGYDTRELIGD